MASKSPNKRPASRDVVLREGYQGKPMPVGAKPPKGPALDVPVKKASNK